MKQKNYRDIKKCNQKSKGIPYTWKINNDWPRINPDYAMNFKNKQSIPQDFRQENMTYF